MSDLLQFKLTYEEVKAACDAAKAKGWTISQKVTQQEYVKLPKRCCPLGALLLAKGLGHTPGKLTSDLGLSTTEVNAFIDTFDHGNVGWHPVARRIREEYL